MEEAIHISYLKVQIQINNENCLQGKAQNTHTQYCVCCFLTLLEE